MAIPRLSKLPIVNPMDIALQKRVLRAFWIKSQIKEIFNPESMYRFLAINLLETAVEKGYDVEQLEKACKRFEKTPQYGDRIETTNFFDDDSEKLQPYSWYLEQIGKGFKGTDFDCYKVPGVEKPMYRKHDGKKIESLVCIMFGGAFTAPLTQSTVQAQQGAGELDMDGKNAALQSHYNAKINGLESLLKKREQTITDLTAENEKLKLQLEVKDG